MKLLCKIASYARAALVLCTLACVTDHLCAAAKRPAAPPVSAAAAPADPAPTIALESKRPEIAPLPWLPKSLHENKDPEHTAKYEPLYKIVYNYHMNFSDLTLTDAQALELFYDICMHSDITYASALLQQSVIPQDILDSMAEGVTGVYVKIDTKIHKIILNKKIQIFLENVCNFLYLVGDDPRADHDIEKELLAHPELVSFLDTKLKIGLLANIMSPPVMKLSLETVKKILKKYGPSIKISTLQKIIAHLYRHPNAESRKIIDFFSDYMNHTIEALGNKLSEDILLTQQAANTLFRQACLMGQMLDLGPDLNPNLPGLDDFYRARYTKITDAEFSGIWKNDLISWERALITMPNLRKNFPDLNEILVAIKNNPSGVLQDMRDDIKEENAQIQNQKSLNLIRMFENLFPYGPVEEHVMRKALVPGFFGPSFNTNFMQHMYDFFYRANTVEEIQTMIRRDRNLLNCTNARLAIAVHTLNKAVVSFLLTEHQETITDQALDFIDKSLSHEIRQSKIINKPSARRIRLELFNVKENRRLRKLRERRTLHRKIRTERGTKP